jgi:hypothetical protein
MAGWRSETNPPDLGLDVSLQPEQPPALPPDSGVDLASTKVPDGQTLDGGADGTAAMDPDAGSDLAPLPGPTLYAMTAKITASDGSSSTSFPVYPVPMGDSFSLLVDWQAGTASTGANGSVSQIKLTANSDGSWESPDSLILNQSLTDRIYFSYGKLKIRPMGNGCSATATGIYSGRQDDVYFSKSFTATLDGVPDRAGPGLQWVPAAKVHPLSFSGVALDELMPAGTTAVLRASPDVVMEIPPADGSATGTSAGVSGFLLGEKALAFGTTYSLEIRPQAVDLGGNLMTELPSLATLPDPGVFAQDGFEGSLKAMLTGDTTLADSTSLPIPSGKKALVIPPASGNCSAGVTFRLAASSGATAVKFSCLTYQRKNDGLAGGFTFTSAVPHGGLVRVNEGVAKTTLLPKPWTGDLPGSQVNLYGDLKQIEVPVPTGVSNEIIFDIQMIRCGTGASPFHGLIIDELRVE